MDERFGKNGLGLDLSIGSDEKKTVFVVPREHRAGLARKRKAGWLSR
ncbi:MAG: hypothetical protein L0215_23600 [Gemmataceae bacterium]|nr:hypothetical protein [Gemmataceae bacterium]